MPNTEPAALLHILVRYALSYSDSEHVSKIYCLSFRTKHKTFLTFSTRQQQQQQNKNSNTGIATTVNGIKPKHTNSFIYTHTQNTHSFVSLSLSLHTRKTNLLNMPYMLFAFMQLAKLRGNYDCIGTHNVSSFSCSARHPSIQLDWVLNKLALHHTSTHTLWHTHSAKMKCWLFSLMFLNEKEFRLNRLCVWPCSNNNNHNEKIECLTYY